ncbi:hypothetical protein PPERSA_09226 [Pseudocohnilembus persalinus]|uniref:Uncharacterized protein n=1 Tax=Pseudocohnilembus persalinus TaxID=266149 RepID=A0A0V0R4F0_PSEPJ|nr:hypothetical protein PPERSA_09226 [Pseudocohnilembus persalinus]|eukprot:KRX09342.1 hypothetical protein PPERSA_09226 [Pseudocohnilembus persalinus]
MELKGSYYVTDDCSSVYCFRSEHVSQQSLCCPLSGKNHFRVQTIYNYINGVEKHQQMITIDTYNMFTPNSSIQFTTDKSNYSGGVMTKTLGDGSLLKIISTEYQNRYEVQKIQNGKTDSSCTFEIYY